MFDSSSPEQNGHHLTDNIVRCIWMNWKICILIRIWLKFVIRCFKIKQGKSEGFDSCDWPSNLTQIGLKSSIFQPVWPWNVMDDPEKQ